MANHGRGSKGWIVAALLGGVAGWMLHGQQMPNAPPAIQQISVVAPPTIPSANQTQQPSQKLAAPSTAPAPAAPPAIAPQPLMQQRAQAPAPQPVPQVTPKKPSADRQTIIQQIINQSLASYPGNCPCPYNSDRAGRSCGRRSAYSRPGGYSPICYATDVTEDMIQNWQRTH